MGTAAEAADAVAARREGRATTHILRTGSDDKIVSSAYIRHSDKHDVVIVWQPVGYDETEAGMGPDSLAMCEAPDFGYSSWGTWHEALGYEPNAVTASSFARLADEYLDSLPEVY